MDPTATRQLGRTGIHVTQLGWGGASAGELYSRIDEADTLAALRRAWEAGIRYFDTAPWYGRGLSELRTGAGLRDRPRGEYVLSSKVGRWLRAPRDPDRFRAEPWAGGLRFEIVFDYTYDGVMRAYEQSQLRLGLGRYDLAIIHDLDMRHHAPETRWQAYFDQLVTSGWRALSDLRDAGLIAGIGAGVNERGLISRYLAYLDPDFFLVAMPYTLLHQEVLDDEFPACVERGVGFVIGAAFQSGILATGPVEGAHYDYVPASEEQLQRVRRLEEVCSRHGVPLAAAALQFPLGHPAVASVIPGAARADHVDRNVAAFRHPIPASLWDELSTTGLLHPAAPVPVEPSEINPGDRPRGR
jgi:D-threo-aldose 1-dehydrogenase